MANRLIHIADEKMRNAQIEFKGISPKKNVKYVDSTGNTVLSKKYAKYTASQSYTSLISKYPEVNELAQAIMDSDPEIDLKVAGRFLEGSSRIYINEDMKIIFKINSTEIVFDPKGDIIEKREPKYRESNILNEKPLIWSGKMFPINEAYKKFVFSRKYQLKHTNGLTYDMLFNMAKTLADKKSLMLIGSGKGTGPVIFQDGGTPFRVFLEGRVQDEKYILLMHLSNLELKAVN